GELVEVGQAEAAGGGRGRAPLLVRRRVRIEEVLDTCPVVALQRDPGHDELVGGSVDPELLHETQREGELHAPSIEELRDQRDDVDWVRWLDDAIVRRIKE